MYNIYVNIMYINKGIYIKYKYSSKYNVYNK